ncbi:MAG: type II toxin-antitoxin system HicB family antitoxin [Syntrophomonadaceae bacterium]|jgi:predicted RNase H-like HicB family nuclease
MEKAYPVILTPTENGYVVYVPDLEINTEGKDIVDAIDMARDAIGLWGITEEDMGPSIPEPSSSFPNASEGEMVTLVDNQGLYEHNIDKIPGLVIPGISAVLWWAV